MKSPLPADGEKIGHFVSAAPFDPLSIETLNTEQKDYYLASQKRLMWWKFKLHKVAVGCAIFLGIMYVSVLFSEFLAPYNLNNRHIRHIYQPPQSVHLFHEGEFIGPFVYDTTYGLDMETLKREYPEDRSHIYKLKFFCEGDSYQFWGLFEANRHLFCVDKPGTVFLLGTDRLGRDMLSRIIYGTRISLTIGLIGVAISFVLGLVIGGLAGYYGGWVDLVVQRIIEVLQSIPSIPLWLAIAAIIPVNWSPVLVYFAISIVLALLDWTGLARAVRSKLLSLREEDYVLAAELQGASPQRIIGRHLIPGFMSHLIASATLTIPNMILGETALSFLGLGLRPPVTSWGVLLNEAQNINVVVIYPWLIIPVIPVVLVILAFNFMGDGLRDAADPYS
ncbi:ABC transporter permease [Rhizobium sp. L1K21]|uniref:ABC transporter permease n=1 Tax=Rhizobium sp. L1K21 TaxID=2954933 RepID=UPI0020930322|nr:ABC transporter permease [Rhizobium sp. L1K21]MCO6187645.1 ABC transporter permease [Rhizobium sp. L1K21]